MGPILGGFKSRNVKLDILYLYLFSCELYCYKCNLAYLNKLKFELYVV